MRVVRVVCGAHAASRADDRAPLGWWHSVQVTPLSRWDWLPLQLCMARKFACAAAAS